MNIYSLSDVELSLLSTSALSNSQRTILADIKRQNHPELADSIRREWMEGKSVTIPRRYNLRNIRKRISDCNAMYCHGGESIHEP